MEWQSNITFNQPPLFLVLFDIDWTLVVTSGLVLRGMTAAYKKYFGVKAQLPPNEVGIGRTDPWMLREIGKANGIAESDIQEKFDILLDFASNYYVENAVKDGGSILPGVPALLNKIDEKGYMRALVSGNLEITAYHKLKRFGLEKGFSFGSFGSEAEDRVTLLKLALQKARDQFHFEFNGHNAAYVADSQHDVIAANKAGIPVVVKLHKLSENANFGDINPFAFVRGTEYQDDFLKIIEKIRNTT